MGSSRPGFWGGHGEDNRRGSEDKTDNTSLVTYKGSADTCYKANVQGADFTIRLGKERSNTQVIFVFLFRNCVASTDISIPSILCESGAKV